MGEDKEFFKVRQALLEVTPELLMEFLKTTKEGFKGTYEIVDNGVPHDARLIDICLKNLGDIAGTQAHSILLKIESSHFDEVEEGYKLLRLPAPTMKLTYCEDDPKPNGPENEEWP